MKTTAQSRQADFNSFKDILIDDKYISETIFKAHIDFVSGLISDIEELEKQVAFWKGKCWEADTPPTSEICKKIMAIELSDATQLAKDLDLLQKQNEIMKEALRINSLDDIINHKHIAKQALQQCAELQEKE